MSIIIRSLQPEDIPAVVAFSLRAWRPVFASFEQVLGPEIFRRVYPDWITGQGQAVETICRDPAVQVWVADLAGRPIGFAAVVVHDPKRAEIDMLAVDPDHQREGIGAALTSFAVDELRMAGIQVVEVATGGDPGHAPARATYAKAGFTGLPLVRYYKAL